LSNPWFTICTCTIGEKKKKGKVVEGGSNKYNSLYQKATPFLTSFMQKFHCFTPFFSIESAEIYNRNSHVCAKCLFAENT